MLYAGAISNNMKNKLKKASIKFFDVLNQEGVSILNAIPTAEGAISVAMNMTNFTIHKSNVLVMGYGNIGKILSKMLYGIGAKVYCEARNKKDIAFIEARSIIAHSFFTNLSLSLSKIKLGIVLKIISILPK